MKAWGWQRSCHHARLQEKGPVSATPGDSGVPCCKLQTSPEGLREQISEHISRSRRLQCGVIKQRSASASALAKKGARSSRVLANKLRLFLFSTFYSGLVPSKSTCLFPVIDAVSICDLWIRNQWGPHIIFVIVSFESIKSFTRCHISLMESINMSKTEFSMFDILDTQ